LLGVNVIRTRHRNPLLIVLSDLQPVKDDVEVAAFQGGNELVPLVLDHPSFYAELRRQCVGEIALETDDLLGLLRIWIRVRSAALSIAAPKQHAVRADLLQVVGGKGLGGPARKQE